MSDQEDNLPIPQGPWGFPGFGGRKSEGHNQTPAGKKQQQNRRRAKQAEKSRKINRRK